jgi:pyruvate dehydrogenase (quinone)
VDVQHRALIQCESEFDFLTHEYHRDRTLVGPLGEIVDCLRDSVRARPASPVLAMLAAERAAARREIAAASGAVKSGAFLHPRDFLVPLSDALPAEAVLVFDTGVHTLWTAQYLQLTRRQRVVVSSHLGTMGFALPAAIAAQLAAPLSPVVAFCGDGGLQMVVGELATAVQNELPLVIVVFNNGILQNVLAQQSVPYGTTLRNPDFVALARAYGADGVVVDGSSDVPAIVADIFGRPRKRPLLIDLRIDPELMFPLSKWEHYTPPPLANHRG